MCLLLDAGANLEAPIDPWYEANVEAGTRALHCAAREGHTKVVELLLARGANVNSLSWWPNLLTPLHVAVAEGRTEVVEILLKGPIEAVARATRK